MTARASSRRCRASTMAGLQAAVRAGDAAGVKNALEVVGADPDALDADLDAGGDLGKGGALHLASFLGCLSVLQVLLRGVEAEREDQGRGGTRGGAASCAALERGTTKGATALMCAAHAGQESAAALLLDFGADGSARNDVADAAPGLVCCSAGTALMFAAWGGHTATAALLLDRGADVAAKDHDGGTVLMFAASCDHTATIALLLDRNADVMATDSNGWTALLAAAYFGHTAAAALLLDRGADVAASDSHGMTALWAAAETGQTQMAALLTFFGAEASHAERQQHPLLAVLHGWCRLRIAAAFRLHGLFRRALRSGAVACDPPATAATAAGVLAASSGAVLQLPGWAGLPVCATTVRLVRDAAAGWSPTRHWLHHGGFRAAVHTLLLVHERGWRVGGAVEEAEPCLPYLDVELWFLVCGRLRRENFACDPLPNPGEAMWPRSWVHAAHALGH